VTTKKRKTPFLKPGYKVIWNLHYRSKGKVGGWVLEHRPARVIEVKGTEALIVYEYRTHDDHIALAQSWEPKYQLERMP
jgi:hypothetical protein